MISMVSHLTKGEVEHHPQTLVVNQVMEEALHQVVVEDPGELEDLEELEDREEQEEMEDQDGLETMEALVDPEDHQMETLQGLDLGVNYCLGKVGQMMTIIKI